MWASWSWWAGGRTWASWGWWEEVAGFCGSGEEEVVGAEVVEEGRRDGTAGHSSAHLPYFIMLQSGSRARVQCFSGLVENGHIQTKAAILTTC